MHIRVGLVAALAWSCSAMAVTFEPDSPGVNGYTTVDKITWVDSKGLVREFYFAKQYPNAITPGVRGYVTRMTWQPDSSSPRIVAEEDPSGINVSNSQGWGVNVMHMHWSQYGGTHPIFGSGASATTTKRDGFDFTQSAVLRGEHHVIYRVRYKQYTTLIKSNFDDRRWVWVTTDWFFADGLDYVIYAHTLDASAGIDSDPMRFMNNTLAPYSLLAPAGWKNTYDWAGGNDAPDGQSFGDFKTFVTGDMRNWTYGGTNTIPFVWMWVTPLSGRGNAEAAYVQTETYAQKNAGEGFANGRDASGSRMPVYPDLNGQEYAYQLNFFDSYRSKRMTWGEKFGILYGGYGSTRGYWNYSLAMNIGRYTDHGVNDLIRETESIHNGMLQVQALIGSLVTSGAEGSGNPTQKTYSPAGYNHVYRTWETRAAGNTVRLRFDLGAAQYKRPTIVVRNFTASEARVTINGAPAQVSTTLDDAGDSLWVTVMSTLSGNNTIEIVAADGSTCTPNSNDCGSDGCGGTRSCAGGATCLSNGTCCTPNSNLCGSDGCGGTRTCATGSVCLANGSCCVPNDNTCGPDGCGGTRTCATGAVCMTNGTCCTPNDNTCGPDGCGGDRGPCGPACTPSCAPGTCGSDGCGGTCPCASGSVCLSNATCCTPNDSTCGPDGCGGTRPPPWDPLFGTYQSSSTTTRAQFSVSDPTVQSMVMEISGSPARTVNLGTRTTLSGGYVRFTGTLSPSVPAGRSVRLRVAQYASSGGRIALSSWFPYLQATPVVDCPAVCTPSCLPSTCGSDGCGGTCGCAAGSVCQTNLTCCTPNLNTCGPDGCGGNRGPCPVTCALGDRDSDGVCDDYDSCRDCWNPDQADVDRDGLSECWRCDWCDGPGTDTDWDGFCDGVDNCPTTWNQSQSDNDRDGIGNACDPTP